MGGESSKRLLTNWLKCLNIRSLFGNRQSNSEQHDSAYQLTWITDYLAVGCAPMSYVEFEAIREQGIDAIVNLCAEFCDLHEIEEKSGFEVYYLPIPDENAPDMEDMEKALRMKVKPFFASDYAGIIEAMRFGKVHVAWFGNKSAMEAVDRAGAEVFVQEIKANGKQGYYSHILTHADNSEINSLKDLFHTLS